MEITASLAADLALLTAAQYDPAAASSTDVAQTIVVFATDVRLAVPSFIGLTITVAERGEHGEHAPDRLVLRVRLLDEHMDADDIGTTLRLSVPTVSQQADRASIQIILYATRPGAFVDMAADVSFLTGSAFDSADLDQHRGMAYERDIMGVIQAESVVGEATGVLIARGHTREQAHAELDVMAELANTDRVTEATALLATLANGGSEPTD